MSRDEFSELVLSHLEEVAAYARRLTEGAWEADDLVQATFERAFRHWRDLRHPDRCRAWLFAIARSIRLDRGKARRARPELRLVEAGDRLAPEPVVPASTVERASARALEQALSALPEAQREAVLLSDLWGFGYEEIADITRVPVNTVRSRIRRGRAMLAARLLEAERTAGEGGGS